MAERGRTLSYAQPQMRQGPPRVLPVAVLDTPVSGPVTMHKYANVIASYLHVKIVAIAGDAEDIALCQAIMSYPEHHDGTIKFTMWHFQTPHNSVARYLDKRIRRGMLHGVSRDVSSIMMRCTQCDAVFPNTTLGQEEMIAHMLEEHADNVLGEFVPMSVDGVPRLGEPERTATPEELNPPAFIPSDAGDSHFFGEDFSLNAEAVPAGVAEAMENADGDENTERVSTGKPSGRGGGRGSSHSR